MLPHVRDAHGGAPAFRCSLQPHACNEQQCMLTSLRDLIGCPPMVADPAPAIRLLSMCPPEDGGVLWPYYHLCDCGERRAGLWGVVGGR